MNILFPCRICQKEKPESEMILRKGYSPKICRLCRNEKNRGNVLKLARAKKWRDEHKEEIRVSRMAKYHTNLQKSRADNLRRVKAMAIRRKNDPSFLLPKILRKRLYTAIEQQYKNSSAVDLVGCSIEDLRVYLESKFTEGMTWDNHGTYGWHIDHIKPCASFDLTDPEQQKKCFHYTNLQPLWAKDNLRKHASIINE